MGEAKRRGTKEERAANPKGYPQHKWTEEDKEKFIEGMKDTYDTVLKSARKSLFSPIKKKEKRWKKVKTGG